jgi:hypothetical protein
MTLIESLKWLVCWPWSKEAFKLAKFDVGISVAEAILLGGDLITITRKGAVTDAHYEWYYTSAELVKEVLHEQWVLADNKTYYNRDYIFSYEVKTVPYWVYADNKPVQA